MAMDRPEIELTAEGLLAFFATGYAASAKGEGHPLDDVLIDGIGYDLELLASAINAAILKAREEAFEEAAKIADRAADEHGKWKDDIRAAAVCDEVASAIRQHSQKGER